jgi:phenylacetate-CoA ligase
MESFPPMRDASDGDLLVLRNPEDGAPATDRGRDAARPHDCLEFWESEHTRPAYPRSGGDVPELIAAAENYLDDCMDHPYLPVAEIRAQQLARMQQLVELAYTEIPVYRDKYQTAGFSPADLREWNDIQKIPVITKPELVAAFPDRCVNARYNADDLFPTRSSGSSGQTLLIRVDYDAILTDTIQGVRQFALQSGLKYCPEDLLTHVYTVPWWFDSIGGRYQTAFISNLIPPARVAEHLRHLGPKILSLYPSNLDALMPHADAFSSSLYLAVTHSEYSSRAARQQWSRRLGVPVLDEYSSEEATRIALELPCGHYHVCEDSVHLDVLDPQTLQPQIPGRSGLAVVTNLLNEAMPFIRYVQGDYVTQPASTGRRSPASTDGSTTRSSIVKVAPSRPAAFSTPPTAGCSTASCTWHNSRSSSGAATWSRRASCSVAAPRMRGSPARSPTWKTCSHYAWSIRCG